MFKYLATVAAVAAFNTTALAQDDVVKIPTRFGELKTNSDGDLQFKGKTIAPAVNLFSSSAVLATFKLASADVVFISQAAGNACPGQFVFVTVSSGVAAATPPFGTCHDDDVKPNLVGESISFSMKKVGGKGSTRYVYERGLVLQDGKPLK